MCIFDIRYYVDFLLGVVVLGFGFNDLVNDLNIFGLFFEMMCICDFCVYVDVLDGLVYYYRDKNGLECDVVVYLCNGVYGLIEIKLGGEKFIEDGVKILIVFINIIDIFWMKVFVFCMVLIGVGDFVYRWIDGVYVVFIGCLKD